jgi:hypothetical protein
MNLEISNKQFEFRGFNYTINDVEYVDGFYFHIITNKNVFCFDLDTTINDVKYDTFEDIKSAILNG